MKKNLRWKKSRVFSLAALGTLALTWAMFHWVLPHIVTLPEGLLADLEASPAFVDREGRELRRLLEKNGRRTGVVDSNALPWQLAEATVGAEDKRFFRHGGIDYLASLRAGRDLVIKRRVVSGASTITHATYQDCR